MNYNILVEMKKTGKGKKQDKCPEQDDFDDLLRDKCEANASVASSPAPTTTIEDILTAINTLGSRVDMRFTELNGVISDFKAVLTEVSKRVSSTEAATESHKRRLEGMEGRYDAMASQYKQQQVTHPAWFVVTVNSNTGTFNTPAEAEKFLSCKCEGWDVAASAAASRGTDSYSRHIM